MENIILYSKLSLLPENLKEEVSDFVDFLISKSKNEKKKIAKPTFGSAKGVFKIGQDFDKPIEGFKEYM